MIQNRRSSWYDHPRQGKNMRGFEKFGVQELTRPEQREILGGEGFFRAVARGVGIAVGNLLDWFEESADETWLRQAGDWREDAI